jgi:hypothetical protein
MSAIRPSQTGRADLLMSVDRGWPEVSAIRSNRREQPIADIAYLVSPPNALSFRRPKPAQEQTYASRDAKATTGRGNSFKDHSGEDFL